MTLCALSMGRLAMMGSQNVTPGRVKLGVKNGDTIHHCAD